MKEDKRKEIKDQATREMLTELFNNLDDKKQNVINSSRELVRAIQTDNRFYVKEELIRLLENIKLLTHEFSDFAVLLYGEGAASNAYALLDYQNFEAFNSWKKIVKDTTIFDKESERSL